MPIGESTQIHFAAEGKGYADQQHFRDYFSDFEPSQDAASIQVRNPIAVSGSDSIGTSGDLHFFCTCRSAIRGHFEAGARGVLLFGADPECR